MSSTSDWWPVPVAFAVLGWVILNVWDCMEARWARDEKYKPKVDLGDDKVRREVAKKEALQKRGGGGQGKGSLQAPGQYEARSWIVLDLGQKPSNYPLYEDEGAFRLHLYGAGGRSKSLSLRDIRALGATQYKGVDWHCVTGWSFLGLGFVGVPLAALEHALGMDGVEACWTCLHQRGADGYTSSAQREDMGGAFLALGDARGKLLPFEHGGVRIISPELYGWKSVKYLTELHFLDHNPGGFWEALGCHPRGRWRLNVRPQPARPPNTQHPALPAAGGFVLCLESLRGVLQERFVPKAQGVWRILLWITTIYRDVGGYGVWVTAMQWGGAGLGALSRAAGAFREAKGKGGLGQKGQ